MTMMRLRPCLFNCKRGFSTSTHEALLKNSNVTRIRIWKSGYHNQDKQFIYTDVATSFFSSLKPHRVPNIGHVSIETSEIYASLWPEGLNIFNKKKPMAGDALSSTPLSDELSEGRPPDIMVDLHTLNVQNINNELTKFNESGNSYHLVGSNYLMKYLGTNNCTGLAVDLLERGGIQQLISRRHFVREYIIATPNNVVELVLEAQAREVEVSKNKASAFSP